MPGADAEDAAEPGSGFHTRVIECAAMDNAAPSTPRPQEKPAPPAASPVLHRVCIQCNNMFRVPPEQFDAKQCPNCHKG